MPLTDHAPLTSRFVFASCAATTRSPLSPTQRAAIIMALHDPAWVPATADIPDTWAVVEAWHEGIQKRSDTRPVRALAATPRGVTP